MKKLSILSLLAGTTLLCAVPVSLQLSQDKLSVSFDSAIARVGNPLSPGSVAGVSRRVDRRAARRAYGGGVYGASGYGGYGYGGYVGSNAYGYGGYIGSGVERRVERRMARRAYYGGTGYDGYGYGYGMAAAAAVGTFAGGMYGVGSDYNYRNTYIDRYVPSVYYGPVCDPRVDRLCQ